MHVRVSVSVCVHMQQQDGQWQGADWSRETIVKSHVMDRGHFLTCLFAAMLLLFYVWAIFFWPGGLWDLSSMNRDQTPAPCIGRQSLNYCTTNKVPKGTFKMRWLMCCFKLFAVSRRNVTLWRWPRKLQQKFATHHRLCSLVACVGNQGEKGLTSRHRTENKYLAEAGNEGDFSWDRKIYLTLSIFFSLGILRSGRGLRT